MENDGRGGGGGGGGKRSSRTLKFAVPLPCRASPFDGRWVGVGAVAHTLTLRRPELQHRGAPGVSFGNHRGFGVSNLSLRDSYRTSVPASHPQPIKRPRRSRGQRLWRSVVASVAPFGRQWGRETAAAESSRQRWPPHLVLLLHCRRLEQAVAGRGHAVRDARLDQLGRSAAARRRRGRGRRHPRRGGGGEHRWSFARGGGSSRLRLSPTCTCRWLATRSRLLAQAGRAPVRLRVERRWLSRRARRRGGLSCARARITYSAC
eukprot:SAG31_NODE_2470_length_5649_cov_2.713694_1_plen_262_part_00